MQKFYFQGNPPSPSRYLLTQVTNFFHANNLNFWLFLELHYVANKNIMKLREWVGVGIEERRSVIFEYFLFLFLQVT